MTSIARRTNTRMTTTLSSGQRELARGLKLIALFNLVFAAFILWHPFSTFVYKGIVDVLVAVGPFLALPWCFARAKRSEQSQQNQWPPLASILLGCGVASYAIGQTVYAYYEIFLPNQAPFPSWADAGYLSVYPFLVAGILLLPGRQISLVSRARVFFDSLMTMTAVVTFSWYFVLGPTLQQGQGSLFAKLLSAAYPMCDLVMVFCLLLLALPSRQPGFRPMIQILSAGLISIVVVDSMFGYESLHDSYESGHLQDTIWTIAYMLVALAGRAAQLVTNPKESMKDLTTVSHQPRIWRHWQALLPYSLLPAVGALLVYTLHKHGNNSLESGVTVGASVLVGLLIARQFFSTIENQKLNAKLRTFNDTLEDVVTKRTEELNTRTDQLTALLKLTTAINDVLDVEQVISIAGTHTQQALHADAIVLWLQEHEMDDTGVVHQVQLQHGLMEHEPLLAFMTTLTYSSEPPSHALPVPYDKGACLQAPVKCQGCELGTLGVVRWTGDFNATEVELLESIGRVVGTALANARQFHAVREVADRDPVTGLFNHRAIHEHLDRHIYNSSETNVPVSLIMMDMNNFKLFNDTYGHPVGDQVLKHVAQVLTEACEDLECAGRYGGDEFLLILPGSDTEKALIKAQRLQKSMAQASFAQSDADLSIPVTLSFGIAEYPLDSTNRHELLTIADSNLYTAKHSERGIVGTTRLQRTSRQIRGEGSFSVLDAMVAAVDNKDRYTQRHSDDVTKYALWIGEELRLSSESLRVLRLGAMLHDVGKIGVPGEILQKPGRLTLDEYEVMKQHPQLGALIVGALPGMEGILDAIRYHHERWDGSGYPDALQGETIPMLGRILAVADAVSAMTTDRPYRKGMDWEAAIQEIRKNTGSQFDPAIARAFLKAAETRLAAEISGTSPFLQHVA